MSYDTPEDNRAFREDHGLPFPLLSDVDHEVGRAYGADPPPDHRFAGYAMRVSFLVDPDGRVATVYEVSDIAAHPAEVLADLRSLQTA